MFFRCCPSEAQSRGSSMRLPSLKLKSIRPRTLKPGDPMIPSTAMHRPNTLSNLPKGISKLKPSSMWTPYLRFCSGGTIIFRSDSNGEALEVVNSAARAASRISDVRECSARFSCVRGCKKGFRRLGGFLFGVRVLRVGA